MGNLIRKFLKALKFEFKREAKNKLHIIRNSTHSTYTKLQQVFSWNLNLKSQLILFLKLKQEETNKKMDTTTDSSNGAMSNDNSNNSSRNNGLPDLINQKGNNGNYLIENIFFKLYFNLFVI